MPIGNINIAAGDIDCDTECGTQTKPRFVGTLSPDINERDRVSYPDPGSGRVDASTIVKVDVETILKPSTLTANPAGHLKGDMFAAAGLEFAETIEVLNSTRPGGKADIKNIDQDNDGFVAWTSKGKYPSTAQTLRFTRGGVSEDQSYDASGNKA